MIHVSFINELRDDMLKEVVVTIDPKNKVVHVGGPLTFDEFHQINTIVSNAECQPRSRILGE